MDENDKMISDLRKEIASRRSQLGPAPVLAPKTSLILLHGKSWFLSDVNLNVLDSAGLVVLLGIIVGAADVASRMKWPEPVLCGYPLSSWAYDVNQRIASCAYKEAEKELVEMEAELSKLLSEGAKRAEALEKIKGKLGV